ncbi:MAG: class I SAM-dependent methyltransferase [Gemmatimonadetes bacterium]|nr:class I SAM-dependent methyltransferase [Gemmatimonadota bacterium]
MPSADSHGTATPLSHSVRRHLRVDIVGYDAAIRQFIPGYDTMLVRAAAAVASVAPALVLDLGAGTGALSEAILWHEGVGVVELVDVDPEMLSQARVRLKDHGDRVRFTLRSFADPIPSCDAVAASLSLHHIATLDAKAEIFRRVATALRPGGVLVNADVTMPAEGPDRDMAFRGWADHLVSSGIPEARAWKHFAEWASEDTYFPLEEELRLLRAAGFDARCDWQEGPSTVVVASLPG